VLWSKRSGIPAATPTATTTGDAAEQMPPRPTAPARTPSERERLVEAMEKCGWVQAKAARLLGLSSRQIGYALRKHQIELRKL